ncbi:MAG TPA: ammonia-forming cytochrome c nitrite reductase subunit c552 [Bacteroidales bacterium]|nr:ammonia-forming cytochrome c nitrite reductase subunit c552 [Bacteroidales bacterium]
MRSKRFFPVIIIAAVIAISLYFVLKNTNESRIKEKVAFYSGSESCRPCHERFYNLWAPSHHGLAMQPVTDEFINSEIKIFDQSIRVGNSRFRVIHQNGTLIFCETDRSGNEKMFQAIHTMGGKYVYYFLTELEKGRLQVLPLAYDCLTHNWYNNPESGVRHFETMEDSPLDWMSHLYTFNTSCYSCHVSQLNTNFDPATLEYNTEWQEPGINCETCHGPSSEHIRVCVEAGEGIVPGDLKIIITGNYTPDQHNSSCGSCHGKSRIIAPSYQPGDPFYDYFDLLTLEDPDFYADGRDLGENYTMTSWSMNRCKDESELHCITCHTSSGRYKFSGDNSNDACMPCHNEKVSNVSTHTFHGEDSAGSKCISCHMPKTTFARMDRSDHSFRPPMPEATIAFGSPNACNICHDDKSPAWANRHIDITHKRDYQSETVETGKLIRQARNNDWSNIGTITDGLIEDRFDEVFATSFIRLLEQSDDPSKWTAIMKMSENESALVRSAAAHSLYLRRDRVAFDILVKLADDRFRVVRHNAAFALSSYSQEFISDQNVEIIRKALSDYESSMLARPDDWASFYDLGNFFTNLGFYPEALDAYTKSMLLNPEAIMPMVNAGYIYSVTGNQDEAEKLFHRALSFVPDHEAALLNLALLYGERGDNENAEIYLRRLLEVSEENAVAAYNLSIIVSRNDPVESLYLSRLAMKWDQSNVKYSYTYCYFLNLNNRTEEAIEILEKIINSNPGYLDGYLLLSDILIGQDKKNRALEILNKAFEYPGFTEIEKETILNILKTL